MSLLLLLRGNRLVAPPTVLTVEVHDAITVTEHVAQPTRPAPKIRRMTKPKIFHETVFEDEDVALMDYLSNIEDVALGQDQIDTITYRIWEHDCLEEADAAENGTEVGSITTLDVSEVIFDDIQTGQGWPSNLEPGWNFRFILPGTRLPNGSSHYRIVVTFTPTQTSDSPFHALWVLTTLKL